MRPDLVTAHPQTRVDRLTSIAMIVERADGGLVVWLNFSGTDDGTNRRWIGPESGGRATVAPAFASFPAG